MANLNTNTTYTSSTGLTTANVAEYFSPSNSPSFGSLKAHALVTFAAETLLNPAGTAVLLNIPLFSLKAHSFAPISVITECVTALTQGGTSTSTTLVQALAVAATPATVGITTGTTPTTINQVGVYATASALVGRIATTGTAIHATQQFQTDPVIFTSTTPTIVMPGQTLYLRFTPSGTLTTSTTYTGVYKFYILGDVMSPSPILQ